LYELVVRSSSPADRAFYTGEPFASAYRACLDAGFRQGPAGYARDLVCTFGAWPFRPEDTPVPVDLWYGDADASAVHSPDRGARLAARLPRARRFVVADGGGALLWTHTAEILRSLTGRAT
jgi:pimeloyl-ACP methyl ester carboxylesterase